MSVPVTIENEHLRLDVWPQFGGKISSIIDKSDGYELLFSYPQEFPTRCQYATRYTDGWFAGWDECFPAVDAGPYPVHPYEGILIPDHGEVWPLPTTAVPTRDGITTVWHGLRFGYRLTRKLYLESASILAAYTLVNLSPFDFYFCWAQHAMFSTTVPVKLNLGTLPLRDGGAWPAMAEDLSFDRTDALPTGTWKNFSAEPIKQPITVLYPTRDRALDITYNSESGLPAYWGVWINNGGWEGHKHLSLEPTTGRFDSLDKAVADQSAGVVPASGKIEWATRFDLRAM